MTNRSDVIYGESNEIPVVAENQQVIFLDGEELKGDEKFLYKKETGELIIKGLNNLGASKPGNVRLLSATSSGTLIASVNSTDFIMFFDATENNIEITLPELELPSGPGIDEQGTTIRRNLIFRRIDASENTVTIFTGAVDDKIEAADNRLLGANESITITQQPSPGVIWRIISSYNL